MNNIFENKPVLDNKNQEKKDNNTTTKNKVEVVEKKEKPKAKTTNKKANSTTDINKVATSQVEEKENSLDNCYVLTRTYTQNIKQKNGENKPYVMGEFYDMEDKQFNVAINPKDAEELQKCDMGTVAKLDLKTIGDVHFALGIEYVEKCEKNVAA